MVNIKHAINLHKSGQLNRAKDIYKQYLKQNPDSHFILNLLGFAEYEQKNYAQAVEHIKKAVIISPNFPEYHKNLGNCYKNLGRYAKAAQCYQKALKINPHYVEAYYDLGVLHLLSDEYDKAVEFFNQALAYRSDYTDALINLAFAKEKLGKYPEAVLFYSKAIQLNPNDELIYNNIGQIYRTIGDNVKAVSALKKAVQLNPHSSELYCNLGLVFREMKQFKNAIDCFEKAVAVNPQCDEPYLHLGNIYQQKGKHKTAINWYEKALSLNSNNGLIHAAIGQSLYEDKKEKRAIEFFLKAIQIDSELSFAYVALVQTLLNVCDWSKLEKYSNKLDALSLNALENGARVYETPFLNLIRHSDPKLNFKIAKAHSQLVEQNINRSKVGFDDKLRSPQKKISLGYLSNNFRNHPTANLLMDIFKLHNRDEFNVYCYSYGPDDKSFQRKFLKQTADHFIDLHHLTNSAAARRIYDDQIDILVDLVGYLKDGRIEIAAYHPAPLQVRWLGMAGTTGADFYDYLISDQIVTPETDADFYSERFVYLPGCYQVNSNQSFQVDKRSKRHWGLPEDHFIFCSFNSAYKINSQVFECWLNILENVPDSILWLMVENKLAEENLKLFSQQKASLSERIFFAKRVPRMEHLQRLACADLALDTIQVNGAATTSDALWANVPVLTIKGQHFASRMSASLLHNIGLSELIFHDLDSYKNKAIYLAQHPQALKDLNNKLARLKEASSLFNTEGGVKTIEKAYKMIWNLYLSGDSPKLLKV